MSLIVAARLSCLSMNNRYSDASKKLVAKCRAAILAIHCEFSPILHFQHVTRLLGSFIHSQILGNSRFRKSKSKKGETSPLGIKLDLTYTSKCYGQHGRPQRVYLWIFLLRLSLEMLMNNQFYFTDQLISVFQISHDYRIFANSDYRVDEVLKEIR